MTDKKKPCECQAFVPNPHDNKCAVCRRRPVTDKTKEANAYTPRAEYRCDNSSTHYQGCACHEARHHAELAAKDKEIETLRMQLVACGVAAMCNTEKTKAKQRIERDNPYWSASYSDVCAAVDREISLRTRCANLEAQVAEMREEVAIARERLGPAGYKILEEVKQLRTRCANLEAENEALKARKCSHGPYEMYGTDGCEGCDGGRIEMYRLSRLCLECSHKARGGK